MSLPAKYSKPHQYFDAAVNFLRTYSWIYQNSNTCFIKAGTLEYFPMDFKEYFLHVTNDDLNKFPLVHETLLSLVKPSLNDFRAKLKDLIPIDAYKEFDSTIIKQSGKTTNFRKMNPKKQHEITRLAQLINQNCEQNHLLVDFGAGLGYLSEILYSRNNNALILGLEADEYRVEAAQKRQRDNMPQASDSIVYMQTFITENSSTFIENHAHELTNLHQRPQPCKMVIIGLHACADLTVTSMRLFLQMGQVRQLIIMPCCYHKLQMTSTNSFINFPLSNALKSVVSGEVSRYFNRPFLRLACQQTTSRWAQCSAQEHVSHGREMFWRAIAESILDKSEIVVKSRKNLGSEICATFTGLCQRYTLMSKQSNETLQWTVQHEQRFNEVANKYSKEGPLLSEALTCLQTAMQKLCENIVLYDRLCYMQEYAVTQGLCLNVRYEKLLDEKLSPRCYVLIAKKL